MRWRFSCSILVLACTLLVIGCDKGGKDGESKAEAEAKASAWDGLCEAYVEMCPDKKGDLDTCKEYCNPDRFQEKEEMCTFMFCGRETEMCDNEEEDDASVMACIEKQPWKN